MMRTSRIWITMLLMIVFLFGLAPMLYAGGKAKKEAEEKKLVGKNAPDFTLPLLYEDEDVMLSSFKNKKAVVLDFFATWCGPCRKNLPLLDDFYEKHGDEVEVFALTMENDIEMLEEFFDDEKNAVSFGVLLDPEATTKEDYPFQFIPYMVVIDKKGKVVATHTGYDPEIVAYLEKTLGLESDGE